MRNQARPPAPLFFVSYARSARSQDVIRFFDDLSYNVAEIVGVPTGSDPGFMDRSIPAGARWTPGLLGAIGNCHVLVALLSPRYVTSDWCGKEWDAFTQRTVRSRADGRTDTETAIIPVIWTRVRLEQTPKVIQDVQRFSPANLDDVDITTQYQTEGIFGLMQMHREVPYAAVVWRLAQRIAEVYESHEVEPRTIRGDRLRNVFPEHRS